MLLFPFVLSINKITDNGLVSVTTKCELWRLYRLFEIVRWFCSRFIKKSATGEYFLWAQPHFIETFFFSRNFQNRILLPIRLSFSCHHIAKQKHTLFWYKTRFSLTLMKFTVDFGFQLMSFNLKSEFQNNSKENEIRQLLLHTAHRSS